MTAPLSPTPTEPQTNAGHRAAPPPGGAPTPEHAHAPAPGSALRGMAAAICAATMTGFALSMTFPYFSLSLQGMGADGLLIGINAAAPAVAMILGLPLQPAILRRLGLPGFLGMAAILTALALLPLPLIREPWAWTALRFVHGFAVAAAFYGSELWIVSAAPPARRGAWIGIYGVALSFGFLSGPAALQAMGLAGWGPPLLAAALALLALIPIALARRAAPKGLGAPVSLRGAFGFLRTDPTVMACVACFGAVETGAFAMLPVWGKGVGMTETEAIRLSIAAAAGNVALQFPLGWTADRLPRRLILAAAALFCPLGAGLAALFSGGGVALWITVAALGGMAVALYSVSLTELGARYEGARLSQATAAFMMSYGVGALIVPPIMGAAADAAPPHGMLWALAAAGLLTAAVVLSRGGRAR